MVSGPISGGVDQASATETVYMGLISVRVKPKTIKSDSHNLFDI